MDDSIIGAKEEVIGAGAKASNVILEWKYVSRTVEVTKGVRLEAEAYVEHRGALLWKLDLRDFKEVECFPLFHYVSRNL